MEPNQPKKSPLLKWSLIVGIVIVLNMFFNYALSLVYKEPQYPDTRPQIVEQIKTADDCIAVGGQWTENLAPVEVKEKDQTKGYCDPDYTARNQYEIDRKEYNRNVFMILVALGALVMGIGIALKEALEVVAIAFSWGGVLSLLIASMRYWSVADNLVKVLILAAALGALIWVAVKKFGK